MSKFYLDDYKEELKSKQEFGYSEDFAQDIAMMAESLADYFGDDYKDVVYDAIKNCKIVVAGTRKNSVIRENVCDVLERENIHIFGDKEYLEKMDNGYFAEPVIEFDNGTYKLVGVKRIIVLPAYFNSYSPASLGILARACIKLVKSSIGSYKIRGNVLTTKRGFMTKKENLEYVDGQVTRTLSSCKGMGMQAGMDCYDQLCLIRLMYEDSYDVHGEDQERLLAGYIFERYNMKDELRLCEIAHDDSQLKEAVKQNLGMSIDEFLSVADKLDRLEQNKKMSLMDEGKLKIALIDLDNGFSEVAKLFNGFEEAYATSEKTI